MITDRLSRPNQPITTEWSLHPEIIARIFEIWGTLTVDRFATVHNTHLPQFVSDSGAASTGDRCSTSGLAGAVDVHVSTVPIAQQSNSETTWHPGGQGNSNSPLVAITPTPTVCLPPSPLSTTEIVPSACMHGGSHAALKRSRIFRGL